MGDGPACGPVVVVTGAKCNTEDPQLSRGARSACPAAKVSPLGTETSLCVDGFHSLQVGLW